MNSQLDWHFENGIVYGSCRGRLVFENLTGAIIELANDDTLPRELFILTDFLGCLSNHGIREVYKTADEMEKLADKYNIIRQAMVIDNPFIVAASILIIGRMRKKNYVLKIFSNVRAAKIWLDDQ